MSEMMCYKVAYEQQQQLAKAMGDNIDTLGGGAGGLKCLDFNRITPRDQTSSLISSLFSPIQAQSNNTTPSLACVRGAVVGCEMEPDRSLAASGGVSLREEGDVSRLLGCAASDRPSWPGR